LAIGYRDTKSNSAQCGTDAEAKQLSLVGQCVIARCSFDSGDASHQISRIVDPMLMLTNGAPLQRCVKFCTHQETIAREATSVFIGWRQQVKSGKLQQCC